MLYTVFLILLQLLLTMCPIVDVIANTVLILLANVRDIIPYAIDIVEEFIAMVSLVFLTAKLANPR